MFHLTQLDLDITAPLDWFLRIYAGHVPFKTELSFEVWRFQQNLDPDLDHGEKTISLGLSGAYMKVVVDETTQSKVAQFSNRSFTSLMLAVEA